MGLDVTALKTKNNKPYPFAVFAYNASCFSMVLKCQLSLNIEKARDAEMPQSLSPYACAAKTLFSANTNANMSIGAKQKCL